MPCASFQNQPTTGRRGSLRQRLLLIRSAPDASLSDLPAAPYRAPRHDRAGRQRYSCTTCQRTFTTRSSSAFSGYRWAGRPALLRRLRGASGAAPRVMCSCAIWCLTTTQWTLLRTPVRERWPLPSTLWERTSVGNGNRSPCCLRQRPPARTPYPGPARLVGPKYQHTPSRTRSAVWPRRSTASPN